jgi:hypothetical protein
LAGSTGGQKQARKQDMELLSKKREKERLKSKTIFIDRVLPGTAHVIVESGLTRQKT